MATASVRPGRSRALVIAVTGAAGGPGRALAAGLARLAVPGSAAEVRKVVALDDRRGDVPGVTWRVVDIRDPLLSHRISDVDVIVHLDVDQSPDTGDQVRRAYNVSGAQSVLTAAAAARVRHVVMVTSTIVLAWRPSGGPLPLPEDAPGAPAAASAAASAATTGIAGDFAEIEQRAAAAAAAHKELDVTVVRPAALVGPGVETAVTRHLGAPRLFGVRGTEQRWQFCHVDDLVSALEQVVLGRLPRVLAVGCDGWLEPGEVAEITGGRRLDLPGPAVYRLAGRLHRAGAPRPRAPVLELAPAVRPWVVDCAALRAVGWKPAYDNAAALRAMIDEAAARKAAAGPWRPGRAEVVAAAAVAASASAVTMAATWRAWRRWRRRR